MIETSCSHKKAIVFLTQTATINTTSQDWWPDRYRICPTCHRYNLNPDGNGWFPFKPAYWMPDKRGLLSDNLSKRLKGFFEDV